jgi:hypothetical protein
MAIFGSKLTFVFKLVLQNFEVLFDIPAKFGQLLVSIELIPIGGLLRDESGCFFEVDFILFDKNGALVASVKPSRTLLLLCIDIIRFDSIDRRLLLFRHSFNIHFLIFSL